MAVDSNDPNVNFNAALLGAIPISGVGGSGSGSGSRPPPLTGTVITPPAASQPFMNTNVDPAASQPVMKTNVDPAAQGIPTGEMTGQGGVVSTPTPFTGGGGSSSPAAGSPGLSALTGVGGGGGGGAISAGLPGGGGGGGGGGGAKVGLDGGGTSTSGYGQFFDDGGAVQGDPDDNSDDSSGPPLSSNIEDRRGPLDDNGQPMSATNNAATPKAGGPADVVDQMGIKPAATVSRDWVSNALNMVDQAVQWGRQQYFGNGQQRQGMPAGDPAQGFANGGAVKAYDDGGAVEDDGATQPQEQQDPGDQGELFPADGGTEPSDDATSAYYGQDRAPRPGAMIRGSAGRAIEPVAQGVGAVEQGAAQSVGAVEQGVAGAASGAGRALNQAGRPEDPDLVKKYLLGMMPDGSSVDPQQATAAEQQTGQQHPGDAALAAIGQQQDPKSGWALIQNDRRQHGLYQAFAQAALDQGHIPAAAKAATQMMDNLPDGLNYDFTPGPHGVVASMSKASGGPVIATKAMNTFQFQQFLKNPTMFDQALDNGGYSLLNQATQAPQKAQDQAPGAPPVTAGGKSDQPEKPSNRQINLATKPYGTNGDHTLPNARAGEEDIDPQILRRANDLFPSVGQSNMRANWIDKMVQQGVSNTQAQSRIDTGVMGKQITADAKTGAATIGAGAKTGAAQIDADAKRDVATTRATAYDKSWATRAQLQLQGVLAKVNQQAMSAGEKERMDGLKALLTASEQGADMSAVLKQYEPFMKQVGIDPPQQAPQVKVQQPQQQQPAASQGTGTVTIGGKQMTREQAKQLYDQQFGGQ